MTVRLLESKKEKYAYKMTSLLVRTPCIDRTIFAMFSPAPIAINVEDSSLSPQISK